MGDILDVNFNEKGFNKRRKKIKQLETDGKNAVITEACNFTRNELIKECRIKVYNRPGRNIRRSGALLKSFGIYLTLKGVSRVGTNKKYAGYLDKGTGIHGPANKMIRPITAKALMIPVHFAGNGRNGGTSVIFRKTSEGIKPTHFIQSARNNVSKNVNKIIKRGLNKAIKNLGLDK